MNNFDAMVKTLKKPSPTVEDIDNSYRDEMQDAWLRALTTLKRRDTILPEAETPEELREEYKEDAGLFHRALETRRVDSHRRRTSGIQKDTSRMSSFLRGDDLDDEPNMLDMLEDDTSTAPHAAIEARDELERIVADMPPDVQKAVRRFMAAWIMQEQGYSVPVNISSQIAYDRARYGLALVLKKGRPTGGTRT